MLNLLIPSTVKATAKTIKIMIFNVTSDSINQQLMELRVCVCVDLCVCVCLHVYAGIHAYVCVCAFRYCKIIH